MHSILDKLCYRCYATSLTHNTTCDRVHGGGQIGQASQQCLQIAVQFSIIDNSKYGDVDKLVTSLLLLQSRRVCGHLHGVDTDLKSSCDRVIKAIRGLTVILVLKITKSALVDVHGTAWSNGLGLSPGVGS